MHIRNLVSPIALAAALSLSGGAMAQTTIAGTEIPAEDLPQVQAHCDSLAAAGAESLTEDTEDDGDDAMASDDADDGTGDDGDDDGSEPGPNDDGDDDANGDDGGEDENDPASEDGEASDLDNALTSIDLDALTLEDCRAAGLVD